MTTKFLGWLVLINLSFFFSTLAARAQQATPRELLNRNVADLQRNPNNQALREEIIKLASEIKPPPLIPEEARRYFIRGNTVLKDAKSNADYDEAIARYNEALRIAPWWGDAYFNLARALELRQKYLDAINVIRLYLLTSPQAGDARLAKDKIYEIEEKQDRAAKAARADQKPQKEKQPKDIVGDWYFLRSNGKCAGMWHYVFDRSGSDIVVSSYYDRRRCYKDGSCIEVGEKRPQMRLKVAGTEIIGKDDEWQNPRRWTFYYRGTINPDFTRIDLIERAVNKLDGSADDETGYTYVRRDECLAFEY